MEHLPPWLRNVPLPPAPDEDDVTPAWLRGIDSLTPPPPPAVAVPPDWLTADEPMAEATSVPDWLAELQAEVSDPLADAQSAAWLRDADSGPSGEAVPPVEPPPTTSSRLRMPMGPTDLLRSIGYEEALEPASEPSLESEVPADVDTGVPDWLRELSNEEITEAFATAPSEPSLPTSEPAAKAESISEPALDDWLKELDRIVPETSSTDWSANVAPGDETVFAPDAPAWLDPNQSAASDTSAFDLPPWLQNVAGDEPPVAAGSVRLDLPTWLLDDNIITSAPSTTTPPVAPDAPTLFADSNAASLDTGAADGGSASWSPDEGVAGADAVPEWLLETERQLGAAGEEMVLPSANTDEAPAWLQAEEPLSDVPAWLQAEEPTAPTDDVPAWLRAEESTTPTDDVPAWLRAEESTTPTDDVPAWLRAEEPARDTSSEIPTWLREADAG
ncbi:MAG: hypothetical protein ACP5UR_15780, partial [Chloroflexus sp.]